jgi:hypothetical protein
VGKTVSTHADIVDPAADHHCIIHFHRSIHKTFLDADSGFD